MNVVVAGTLKRSIHFIKGSFFETKSVNIYIGQVTATVSEISAFGFSAEIERNLISQRTKEALARKRAEGVILGRPKGRKSSKTKLTGQEKKIRELLDRKVSYSAIGRIIGVHRLTVSTFVKEKMAARV